jgi:hypothetical protein
MQSNLALNGSTDGKIDLLKSSRKSVDTLAGLGFAHLPQIQTQHPSRLKNYSAPFGHFFRQPAANHIDDAAHRDAEMRLDLLRDPVC